ncbi:hypothetical protein AK812_SmicGene4969 [Symbiodinium microadriaticum]|uniref:Uncharacterized protein n=1 Tax=Symbiodinium microadriaticum TaxID=2951 RepID=A0A1Q9EUU2_SYMMI|nr:hypothetical protein AK812_SmicGene4969 [Symbiodinium microadriaticum]
MAGVRPRVSSRHRQPYHIRGRPMPAYPSAPARSPNGAEANDDDDFVVDMPLPNLSSIEGGDRVVRRKQWTSASSRSQSFSDIPENPGEVYPRILECFDGQPAQDPGLQAPDDNSDELAKLMDHSGSGSSNGSSKGMLIGLLEIMLEQLAVCQL